MPDDIPPNTSKPPSTYSAVHPNQSEESHHSHYDDRQNPVEPTSAAFLTQSSHIPLPPEKKAVLHHLSHRRANTEIVSQSPSLSKQLLPDQSKTLEDLEHKGRPLNENIARTKLEEGARLLAGWFQGKSEPVNLAVVRQPTGLESNEMTSSNDNSRDFFGSQPNSTMSMTRAQKRMTPTSPLKQVTSTNRFSFFGLKRQDDTKAGLPEPADDEFLNMDITAALFPAGSDHLSDGEALDALRSNADTLLRRLQAAYKQRTFALHEALADKNEKQEELEETRTRVGHLKSQLDGMAEKVQQQEKAMKAMAKELEQERQLRLKEAEARTRSVMLVKPTDDDAISDLGTDLQTPKRSLKRSSGATFTSDSGFESGDESASLAESIFSRREGLESPISTITAPSPNVSQIALFAPTTCAPAPTAQKDSKATAPPVRQSAYDRVLKGLASSSLTSSFMGNSSKCTICHGVPASEAWSVMGVLKEENRGLKTRLSELESVVDDCLSIVGP